MVRARPARASRFVAAGASGRSSAATSAVFAPASARTWLAVRAAGLRGTFASASARCRLWPPAALTFGVLWHRGLRSQHRIPPGHGHEAGGTGSGRYVHRVGRASRLRGLGTADCGQASVCDRPTNSCLVPPYRSGGLALSPSARRGAVPGRLSAAAGGAQDGAVPVGLGSGFGTDMSIGGSAGLAGSDWAARPATPAASVARRTLASPADGNTESQFRGDQLVAKELPISPLTAVPVEVRRIDNETAVLRRLGLAIDIGHRGVGQFLFVLGDGSCGSSRHLCPASPGRRSARRCRR